MNDCGLSRPFSIKPSPDVKESRRLLPQQHTGLLSKTAVFERRKEERKDPFHKELLQEGRRQKIQEEEKTKCQIA